MPDTDDVWANVPGAAEEDKLAEAAAADEAIRARIVQREAEEGVRKHEARELTKRLVAEKEALERGPFSSRVHNMTGVRRLEVPKHLMRDVLYTGSVAVFLGDSQAGKSWVLQAVAACAASGLDWPSMQPNSKGRIPTLYIAAEDGGAIKWRLEFWERAHTRNLDDAPFYAHAEPVDMLNDVMIDEIIEFVTIFKIRLVVVDTISATLGGQEETNENFAKLVRNARRIVKAMAGHGGGSCAFAHHFGKDKEKGGRGGSSLFNDSDIVWELTGEIHAIVMTNKKWKVDENRRTLNLRLDKTNRSAVHIVEHRPTSESVNAPAVENRFAVLEREILALITEFHGVNRGYGLNVTDIRGKLRNQRGMSVSDTDISNQLAAMVLDRKLLMRREGKATLYRPPPVQETMPYEAE